MKRGDNWIMPDRAKIDVIKKVSNFLMVHWERQGFPVMSEIAVYKKVKTVIDDTKYIRQGRFSLYLSVVESKCKYFPERVHTR